MTSIYNIGCFIGAMSTIWTGDILGRPRQIMLGSTIIGIGAIIQTASYGVAQSMYLRATTCVASSKPHNFPPSRHCPSKHLWMRFADFSRCLVMVGRIVAGLGTGMNTATAGVWQAETSKMSSRGKLVIIQMGNCLFPRVLAKI